MYYSYEVDGELTYLPSDLDLASVDRERIVCLDDLSARTSAVDLAKILAQPLPHLKQIIVSLNQHLAEFKVPEGNMFPELQSIDVSLSTISLEGIISLVKAAPGLKEFDMSHCLIPKVTAKELSTLKALLQARPLADTKVLTSLDQMIANLKPDTALPSVEVVENKSAHHSSFFSNPKAIGASPTEVSVERDSERTLHEIKRDVMAMSRYYARIHHIPSDQYQTEILASGGRPSFVRLSRVLDKTTSPKVLLDVTPTRAIAYSPLVNDTTIDNEDKAGLILKALGLPPSPHSSQEIPYHLEVKGTHLPLRQALFWEYDDLKDEHPDLGLDG